MFANSFRIEMSMKEIWPSEIYRCIKEGNAVEELGHFVNFVVGKDSPSGSNRGDWSKHQSDSGAPDHWSKFFLACFLSFQGGFRYTAATSKATQRGLV